MKKDLFEIIKTLSKSGIKTKAIVSDISSALWKELEVSHEKSFFMNPVDQNDKIWIFADLPHYLKLLQNHLVDHGLVLNDGTILNADIVKEVMQKDNGEVKLCHKLLPCHLTVKGNERQKVGPAKILFSATTANAIELLTKNKKAADFFLLVDSFFDVMNSSHGENDRRKPLKTGFGANAIFHEQKNILDKMRTEILHLRVVGKKSMLPFQKAIIMSISSLLGLYSDLSAKGVRFILTSRLTQDALESLFSQIRGICHFYDHPSPTEFISRLKHILLANKLPNLSKKVNCTNEDDGELPTYLTAQLLKEAFNDVEKKEIMINNNSNSEEQEALLKICEDPYPEEWSSLLLDQSDAVNETEEQALTYVAGYIAFRLKNKDPSLGTISSIATNTDSAIWIKMLSHGGLTVPTAEWLETVKKFEKVFKHYHGETFSKEKGVIAKLIKEIETQFPNVLPEAVKLYSRVRTFIRIRSLNRDQRIVSERKSTMKKLKWINSTK